MHTTGRNGVEVGREGRDESFALAGLHLGNIAEMKRRATHELHVEMTHSEGALGCFTHGGKRFRQQVFQRLTVRVALAKLYGLLLQILVTEFAEVVFQVIDRLRVSVQSSKDSTLADAEDLLKNVGHC